MKVRIETSDDVDEKRVFEFDTKCHYTIAEIIANAMDSVCEVEDISVWKIVPYIVKGTCGMKKLGDMLAMICEFSVKDPDDAVKKLVLDDVSLEAFNAHGEVMLKEFKAKHIVEKE